MDFSLPVSLRPWDFPNKRVLERGATAFSFLSQNALISLVFSKVASVGIECYINFFQHWRDIILLSFGSYRYFQQVNIQPNCHLYISHHSLISLTNDLDLLHVFLFHCCGLHEPGFFFNLAWSSWVSLIWILVSFSNSGKFKEIIPLERSLLHSSYYHLPEL